MDNKITLKTTKFKIIQMEIITLALQLQRMVKGKGRISRKQLQHSLVDTKELKRLLNRELLRLLLEYPSLNTLIMEIKIRIKVTVGLQ